MFPVNLQITGKKSRSASHCVKSVRIWSYSDLHFSRIRTEYGEMRTLRIQSACE